MSRAEMIDRGRRVVRLEREALEELERRLGDSFADAVEMVARSPGRVIVAGMGKSGLVGRKIAATLTSTGTPASFLHPVESVHGDLGIVGPDDVAVLISKSGESGELLMLLEHLKLFGVRTIAVTGEAASTLARNCDVSLDAWVKEEACPHDLAPTTSTTAALALGDALAVALLEARGFGPDDFARSHPGGALGRRLLTRVRDVMRTGDAVPTVGLAASLLSALLEISRKGMAMTAVVADGRIAGIFTDGDLRRLIEKNHDFTDSRVADVMHRAPRTIDVDRLAAEAADLMEQFRINQLLVVDAGGGLAGALHIHDLTNAKVI